MPFPSKRHYLERLALNSWFVEFINMAANFPAKNHTHTKKKKSKHHSQARDRETSWEVNVLKFARSNGDRTLLAWLNCTELTTTGTTGNPATNSAKPRGKDHLLNL